MKAVLFLRFWLIFLFIGLSGCGGTPAGNEAPVTGSTILADTVAASTIIYLVRHAEKDTSDAANQDPVLTPEGETRALALLAELEGQPVTALYASNYIRTMATLKPLATAHHVKIIPYEAHDFEGLKAKIMRNNKGATVVVAGHSNTLLPIIQAFGATTDVTSISDQEYDYLFKVTVAPDGTAAVETRHFGAESH